MKTKLVYLSTRVMVAVVLLAMLAVKAFAGETPKVKMVPYSTDKAIIAIDNVSNVISELTIEDNNGQVLYYKEGNIDEKIYSKIFDFKNLNNGTYTIAVKNTYGVKRIKFEVEDNKFNVLDEEEAFSPFIEVRDNVLRVSVLNNKLNDVKLEVTDAYGNAFTKNLGSEFSINGGFNLGSLEAGEYTVSILTDNQTFNYYFEK